MMMMNNRRMSGGDATLIARFTLLSTQVLLLFVVTLNINTSGIVVSAFPSFFDRFFDREEDTPNTSSSAAEDLAKCETYCMYYEAALGRCPKRVVPLQRQAPETCVDACVAATDLPKNGTDQDFALADTLQCRQNHAIMAIKEGEITSSDHCLHAELEGKQRCRKDATSMSQYLAQQKEFQYYYYGDSLLYRFNGEKKAIRLFLGALYLIAWRGRLFASYPWTQVDPPNGETIDCTDKVRYRAADGTCNSLKMPLMGSVGTTFARNTKPTAPLPDSLKLPDPAKVAAILRRKSDDDPSRQAPFNQLCTAWIQYMTHDWFAHDNKKIGESVQLNSVTHWWDGSQLYGSTPAEVASIRADDGKVHLDSNNELDYDPDTLLPITGFKDNFWVGLHLMHTIFIREHNYIVDELSSKYPTMTADEKFNTARLIVAASMAKIHTIEWTPTLLANPVLELTMYSQWFGPHKTALKYFPDIIMNRQPFKGVLKSLEAPYFAMGKYTSEETMYNTSFFIIEEFVSVYRMHPLLPDSLNINDVDVPLKDLTFMDPRELIPVETTKTLLQTLATTPARTLSLQNYPNSLYDIEVPNHVAGPKINLAEIDIQRDRERGLPRYNDARRQLLLEPYTSLDELTDDPTELELLKSVYTDIDQVDFMVGSMVDKDRPEGFAFGVVPFHIFIVMASRRVFSDRFFQEGFNVDSYTQFGMDYVVDVTFRQILVRHFPEYESQMPENPFMNW